MRTHEFDLVGGSRAYGPKVGKSFIAFNGVSHISIWPRLRVPSSWSTETYTKYILPSEFIDNL